MIRVGYQDTLKDLQKHLVDVERRLKNKIAGFAYEVTLVARDKTPEGNAYDLAAGLSGYGSKAQRNYAGFYRRRAKNLAISAETGFHKGAWFYSEQPSAAFNPQIRPGEYAARDVYGDVDMQYRIGEDFYIVAVGPGFASLNDGDSAQAPDGIIAPSQEKIKATYLINLQKYYNEG